MTDESTEPQVTEQPKKRSTKKKTEKPPPDPVKPQAPRVPRRAALTRRRRGR